MQHRLCWFILIQLVVANTWAQPRQVHSINSGWQFAFSQADTALPAGGWQKINLPHTWNNLDILDESPGYARGIGWYRKVLHLPPQLAGKNIELFFEAVSNKAEVFVNGKKAGDHVGAFTGFRINLTHLLNFNDSNLIEVKADNRAYLSQAVPPYSGDFNIMGGIYRDVWLTITNPVHFSGPFGSSGMMFQARNISDQGASYQIKTFIANGENFNGSVQYTLRKDGVPLKTGTKKISNHSPVVTLAGSIPQPRLWTPENPELYQLHVQLIDNRGTVVDEITEAVGFKWVGINSKNEFTLNGKPYKLKGASRHQDYHEIGFALPDALHVRDMELMKDMGCNFIRIAHYPQDPAVYDACDRLGLIAWSEIPVVDRVVASDDFRHNSAAMMQEMLYQQMNHSSVAIWGYHNEVRNLDEHSLQNARMLDSIAKAIDPQRLTAIAFESNLDAPYFRLPLARQMLNVADINGYNVYQGWYRGDHRNIGNFLDTLYALNPNKPIMLSEYGAGSSRYIHSYQPTIFDFSEEYHVDFQTSYLEEGNKRPWMIGYGIWNFVDFQVAGRQDVSPNINNKGMVTTDRQKKDAFYYYKSQWSTAPFVHIAGKSWNQRFALTGNAKTIEIPIRVLSNQDQVVLLVNGVEVNSSHKEKGIFQWNAAVTNGYNQIIARSLDGELMDAFILNYVFIDTSKFSSAWPVNSMHFNVGQTRTFYTDPLTKEQWMPGKYYSPGNWGHIGGEVYNKWPGNSDWNAVREGIHLPIANTFNEPLYQTFVEGLTAWKADVPAGSYRVTILLAEPFHENSRNNKDRIMNINLNDEIWIWKLNLAKNYGVQTAVTLDKIVHTKQSEGITIGFEPLEGKTLLNGVKLERLN